VSPVGIGLVTFACAFGGALVGNYIRTLLPPTHLSKESQDIMRLGMGLVATMTALLLGLVTASARSAFDSQDAAIRTSMSNILTADRLLARYGAETKPIRHLLKEAVAYRLQTTWPESAPAGPPLVDEPQGIPVEQIENQILALSPTTETQRWFKAEALKLTVDVMKTRWRVLESQAGSVPFAFLVVVIFWLTVTFTSFGLYAQQNASVVAVLFVSALSVAAAVFLILELDGPFTGVIKVPSHSVLYALQQLGQ
jgi:hypothetical protein